MIFYTGATQYMFTRLKISNDLLIVVLWFMMPYTSEIFLILCRLDAGKNQIATIWTLFVKTSNLIKIYSDTKVKTVYCSLRYITTQPYKKGLPHYVTEVRIFMVLQLGKKILAFYRTHKFITIFARAEIIYPLDNKLAIYYEQLWKQSSSFPQCKDLWLESIKMSWLNTIISGWSNWL
jgi:hypothetical protein